MDTKLLRSLPIEAVAQRLGMKVSRHRCLCPFHADRNPSLSFSAGRNTFRCWSCDARGDPIELVMRYLNVSFIDACRWLAKEYNVIVNVNDSQPNPTTTMETNIKFNPDIYEDIARLFNCYGTEAQDFIRERNLEPDILRRLNVTALNASGQWILEVLRRTHTEEQLRQCGLLCGEGTRSHFYFPTPCLLFYYYSVDGKLLAVQSRYLGAQMRFLTAEAQARHDEYVKHCPRFKFARGCVPLIYNQPVLKTLQPDEVLWIAEGITDCLALLSSGRKAIAIPSATLLTRQNIEILSTVPTKNWAMYPDQDPAGESLFLSLLSVARQLGATLTRHQLPQGCKDFSDYYKTQIPNT